MVARMTWNWMRVRRRRNTITITIIITVTRKRKQNQSQRQSRVTFIGRDLPSEGAKCLVGGSSSEAWEAGPGELACAATAGAPGFAAVSLEGWTEGQAVFEYREAAVVRSVAPRANKRSAGEMGAE